MDKEELINGYFEGSLSESQLAEFEELLQTDSKFKSDFEFEKELQLGLKKEARKELKELFSALGNEKEEKVQGKVISMRPWLAAASIALLAGLASWFLFFSDPDLNTAQLYASNFTPYENVVYPIERGNQLDDLLSRAFTAYEDEKYEEALALFKELNVKQNDSYIDFYSAMVLMQLNNQEAAIPLLKGYIEKDGELKTRATWYLALAYLKLGEVSNSKAELKKLIALGDFKKEAAAELLDKI